MIVRIVIIVMIISSINIIRIICSTIIGSSSAMITVDIYIYIFAYTYVSHHYHHYHQIKNVSTFVWSLSMVFSPVMYQTARNYISTSAIFLLSSSTIGSYHPPTCHLTYLHCTHSSHLFHAFTWTISTAAVLYKWSMWSAHRGNCRVAIRFSDRSEISVFSLDLLREYFYVPTKIHHPLANIGFYLVRPLQSKTKCCCFFSIFANYPGSKFEYVMYVCVLIPQNSHKMETAPSLFHPQKPSKASGTTKLLSLRWRRTVWGSCNGKFVERPPTRSTLGFYRDEDVNWKKIIVIYILHIIYIYIYRFYGNC